MRLSGVVATVGKLEAFPGASNVIAGEVGASLDVRHAVDAQRKDAAERMLALASEIAKRRGLAVECVRTSGAEGSRFAIRSLTAAMENAVRSAGFPVRRMTVAPATTL